MRTIPGDFNEVYCQCSLEIFKQLDVKGLYKYARPGEISNFTGVSAPMNPEVAVNTNKDSLAVFVERVLEMVNLSRLPCKGVGVRVGN